MSDFKRKVSETVENDYNSELIFSKKNILNKNVYKVEIVWRNVINMSVLHLAALYGLYLGCIGAATVKQDLIVWFLNFLAGFSILAGAHRLWSHRSYKGKWPLRLILAFFQTAAMQNDIYEWCRDHRVHHKYSDTDADPHNSKRGFFFAHMGWLLCKKHPDVIRKGKTVDMSDLMDDPIVRIQRKYYKSLVILIRGFLFCGVIGVYLMGQSLWQSLCTNAFCYVVSLHHTWLVNSAAHLYGTRPYDKSIRPRENRAVVYASMGEGYHNYHHTFPWDYSASEYGWKDNFNLATAFIDLCAKIGLAYDRRIPSEEMIIKRIRRTGDPNEKLTKLNNFWDLTKGLAILFWPLIITFSFRLINWLS